MKKFETKELAIKWVIKKADNPCTDNERFAFIHDVKGMKKYTKQMEEGCCGSLDESIIVGGADAIVGCNYGH